MDTTEARKRAVRALWLTVHGKEGRSEAKRQMIPVAQTKRLGLFVLLARINSKLTNPFSEQHFGS